MKPVFQTKFSDDENPHRGNCFAACVASLFELDIEKVPAFENMMRDQEWWKVFDLFCRERGYEPWLLSTVSPLKPAGLCIVGGKSPRVSNVLHAVIFDKWKMVHDPHPSGEGIVGDPEDFIILNPLDPARFAFQEAAE